MSNYVFLIDANKTPMNPIHPAHARELMESGKAAVFRRYPFTLIVNRIALKYCQLSFNTEDRSGASHFGKYIKLKVDR